MMEKNSIFSTRTKTTLTMYWIWIFGGVWKSIEQSCWFFWRVELFFWPEMHLVVSILLQWISTLLFWEAIISSSARGEKPQKKKNICNFQKIKGMRYANGVLHMHRHTVYQLYSIRISSLLPGSILKLLYCMTNSFVLIR